ncbi:DUF4942 domain-containing protein (plasmid) [Pseudoalteromonas lipolytica]|uniref:DUF4942 domain-containing protein n=1 Tax=Pseudoalteromonas lipolytica TaxID=570156 RepID=A0AAD0S3Y0_9GAMM|nr:DUF4942 domain-containing protein [Pseudoalteromonas donghaensis]AXV67669.1 DUF4942 domain-containing protein [Pseudoalteromonas donghaensis]
MGHHTGQLIQTIKQFNQDFEWYPTTDEQLDLIKSDFKAIKGIGERPSLLDVGAGNGKALKFLTEGKRYAIEKSVPLLSSLDKDIFVVGTDFKEQTLIDKRTDIVFCNPPYSEFSYFAQRIIEEANAKYIYLILPSRWVNDVAIQQCIKMRDAECEVLGEYDYLNADRKARAVVNVIRISLIDKRYSRYGSDAQKIDPFSLWFKKNFAIFEESENSSHTDTLKNRHNKNAGGFDSRLQNAMVPGVDLVAALQSMYDTDLSSLVQTYKKLEEIDTVVLKELDVSFDGVKEALKLKIGSLKDKYWRELFSNFDKITDRLTASSREKLLKVLFEHTHVDFNKSNAYALVQWMCKNANLYFDDQLVETVEKMVSQSSIVLYKSNEKTFGKEQWRYVYRSPEGLDRFALDYRIVVTREGGRTDDYGSTNGLSRRAEVFLNDLCTIAGNLGFDSTGCERARDFDWNDSAKKVFTYYDHSAEKYVTLFECRAYYNGNLHLKLNQAFLAKMNVQFGKLKGWVKSPKEAAEEMGVDIEIAEMSFDANFKLTSTGDVLALGVDYSIN